MNQLWQDLRYGARMLAMMVTVLACGISARRATKVNPLVALRCE